MNNSKAAPRRVVAMLLTQTLWSGAAMANMQPLTDVEMSKQTGQAAFYTSYTDPSGSGTGATPSDYGFFRIGLNGDININANIQHLQLGCGGVNGPGCDIDINNLSLSGNPGTGTCPTGASPASCDAVLKNPFLTLAIKNASSLSTRSVVGMQLGAQSAIGLLQSGDNSTVANGINTLSGYMKVQSTSAAPTLTGTVSTASQLFPVYNPDTVGGTTNQPGSPYYTINGKLTALGGLGASTTFQLRSGGFYIPGFSGVNFSVPAPVINGSRITQITVNPTVSLPNIIVGYTPDNNDCGLFGAGACNTYGTPINNPTFQPGTGTYPSTSTTGTQGGPVGAVTTSCSGLGCILLPGGGVGVSVVAHMYGQVNNVSSNVTFVQPLGFVHSIPVNSPLSLSLQSERVSYPGAAAADVAQPGWWMSLSDPVYLGNLTPSAPVSLCPNAANAATCVFPQFAKQFNTFLASNTLNTNDLATVLSGTGSLGVQFGTLVLTPIALNLNGVQLSTQGTIPNCYGGLKFC